MQLYACLSTSIRSSPQLVRRPKGVLLVKNDLFDIYDLVTEIWGVFEMGVSWVGEPVY